MVAARMEKAVVARVQVAIKPGLSQSSKNLSGKVVHHKQAHPPTKVPARQGADRQVSAELRLAARGALPKSNLRSATYG
jgi:hypothetical protein